MQQLSPLLVMALLQDVPNCLTIHSLTLTSHLSFADSDRGNHTGFAAAFRIAYVVWRILELALEHFLAFLIEPVKILIPLRCSAYEYPGSTCHTCVTGHHQ